MRRSRGTLRTLLRPLALLMVVAMVTRTDQRRHITDPILRVERLEEDADDAAAWQEKIEAKLDRIIWLMTTTSVAFTTAAVLFAINLARG